MANLGPCGSVHLLIIMGRKYCVGNESLGERETVLLKFIMIDLK